MVLGVALGMLFARAAELPPRTRAREHLGQRRRPTRSQGSHHGGRRSSSSAASSTTRSTNFGSRWRSTRTISTRSRDSVRSRWRAAEYSEALPLLERATRVSARWSRRSGLSATRTPRPATSSARRPPTARRWLWRRGRRDEALAGPFPDQDRRLRRGARRLHGSGPALQGEAPRSWLARTVALGEAYSMEGKAPEAMASTYKAVELAPRDVEVARGLAACAVRGGLYAEAVDRVQPGPTIGAARHRRPRSSSRGSTSSSSAIPARSRTTRRSGIPSAPSIATIWPRRTRSRTRWIERWSSIARWSGGPAKLQGCLLQHGERLLRVPTATSARSRWRMKGSRGTRPARVSGIAGHRRWTNSAVTRKRFRCSKRSSTDPAYAEPAKRELERQRRIVRLLKTKERGGN